MIFFSKHTIQQYIFQNCAGGKRRNTNPTSPQNACWESLEQRMMCSVSKSPWNMVDFHSLNLWMTPTPCLGGWRSIYQAFGGSPACNVKMILNDPEWHFWRVERSLSASPSQRPIGNRGQQPSGGFDCRRNAFSECFSSKSCGKSLVKLRTPKPQTPNDVRMFEGLLVYFSSCGRISHGWEPPMWCDGEIWRTGAVPL